MRRDVAATRLALALLVGGLAPALPTEVIAMSTPQNQAAQLLLGLTPQAYAAFDEPLQLDLQGRLAALAPSGPGAGPPPGILAVGAPPRVRLDVAAAPPPPEPAGATAPVPIPAQAQPADAPQDAPPASAVPSRAPVPVLVGSLRTGLRDWQLNFRSNLHLFVRRLDGRQLAVIQPLVSMRRGQVQRPSGRGTPPTEVVAQQRVAAVARVDLRERLDAMLGAGRYAVTAVAGDWLSNTVALTLEGAPARPDDAPVPYAGARHVLDGRAGLDAQIDLPPTVAAAEPGRLRAALSLPAEAVAAAADGTAAWTGHVVLIAPDEPPVIVPVRMPVQRSTGAGTGAGAGAGPAVRYNAVFQLDLRAAAPGVSGPVQLYIEAGTRWLGPYPTRLH